MYSIYQSCSVVLIICGERSGQQISGSLSKIGCWTELQWLLCVSAGVKGSDDSGAGGAVPRRSDELLVDDGRRRGAPARRPRPRLQQDAALRCTGSLQHEAAQEVRTARLAELVQPPHPRDHRPGLRPPPHGEYSTTSLYTSRLLKSKYFIVVDQLKFEI